MKTIRVFFLGIVLGIFVLLAPEARAADGLGVNLDVCALDNDSGTFAVDQKFTWILRGGIPDGLKDAKGYVLTYASDPRLTLETGSTMVILHTADGRQRPLRAKEHFTLEEGTHLRLALTPAGMKYAASILGEGKFTPELRLSFRAAINRTAPMGATIPGEGNLRYTDGAGSVQEARSDHPEVHTGGIRLHLTDAAQNPLKGASFRMARPTTGTDIGEKKETLYLDGKKIQVVFLSFFDTADMAGEKVSTLTTNADGRALAYGLPYGTYYLVQTNAPTGYQMLTTPIPVTVNVASHLTKADGWETTDEKTVDNTVSLVNTPFALPEEGDRGTVLITMLTFTALGVALLNSRKLPAAEKQV